MNKIDKLIAELCPAGVPSRPMGEVGEFIRGNGLQKKDFVETGVPCIHYGQIYTRFKSEVSEALTFVPVELAATLKKAISGDLIIATTSENFEDVGKSIVWTGDTEVCIGGHSALFRSPLEPKYVNYFLQTESFRRQKLKLVRGTKVIELYPVKLAEVRIPVPPLEVQREIVKILDAFTQLEAELEAELEARRKQYEHYRDRLLTFPEGGVRWVPMGEIGHFFGGLTGKAKSDFENGNCRFVTYTNIFENHVTELNRDDFVVVKESEKQQELSKGDILFTGSSESAKEAGISSVLTDNPDGKLYLNSFSIGFRLSNKEILDPSFCSFLFRSSFLRKQIIRTANGVTRFNVSKRQLAKVLVPLPDLQNQLKIAETLRVFDSLVNDISIGLPAELAARRKQYEYYRDQLLTFKELTP